MAPQGLYWLERPLLSGNQFGYRSSFVAHVCTRILSGCMTRANGGLALYVTGSSLGKQSNIFQISATVMLAEHQPRRANEHQECQQNMKYFTYQEKNYLYKGKGF